MMKSNFVVVPPPPKTGYITTVRYNKKGCINLTLALPREREAKVPKERP